MSPMSPRLLRPRQTGFNPRSILNLALWLDAADSSTITTSTGVSVWADKSGNGRNATQAVAGKQPIRTNTINGKSVITFQGTDDTMQIAANAAFNTASQTLIVVARQTTAANQALFYKADSNSSEGVIVRYRSNLEFWYWAKNDASGILIGTANNPSTSAQVYATVLQPSSQVGFCNGTQVVSGTNAATYDNNSGPWLGSRRDISEYLAGDIAEVLHWSRALAASERNRVERYLGSKWGITVA
jgi:hypothetical protein